MDDIIVDRSLELISLDAHAADLILLVNYEIDVVLRDERTKQELARRSKQSQLQIHLQSLQQKLCQQKKRINHNDEQSYKANVVSVELLAQTILKECPMIKDDKLDEIRHHLTYLYKRHSEQIDGLTNSTAAPDSVDRLIKSARVRSAANARPRRHQNNTARPKVTPSQQRQENVNVDQQIEEYLYIFESKQQYQHQQSDINLLNRYIEGLYDELEEKIVSSENIRALAESTENLIELVMVNKMLTSAIYRVLREDGNKSAVLAKNALIYFVRISSFIEFIDIIKQYDLANTALTTARFLYNSFVVVVRSSNANKQQRISNHNEMLDTIEALRASTLIMFNLCQIDLGYQVQLRKLGLTKQLIDCVSECIEIVSANNQHAQHHINTLKLLITCLTLLLTLSAYRQNIDIIKQSNLIMDIVKVLDISSKRTNPTNTGSIKAPQRNTLGEIKNQYKPNDDMIVMIKKHYQLVEVSALRLANNLLHDAHLRAQLNKSELFKISLRIFIGHRLNFNKTGEDTIFDGGLNCRPVVLFSSLHVIYQLSCDNKFKKQIAKSKLISKYLLDYAKTIASKLDGQLLTAATTTTTTTKYQISNSFNTNEDAINFHSNIYGSPDTIRYRDNKNLNLEPISIEHLLIAFVLNLTANKYFIASVNQPDICPSLAAYIAKVMDKLSMCEKMKPDVSGSLVQDQYQKITSSNSSNHALNHNDNKWNTMIYLHLKVIRNITQFYAQLDQQIRYQFQEAWFLELMSFSMYHFNHSSGFSDDMILECLGIIGNYIHLEEDAKIDWLKLVKHTSLCDLLMHNLDISRNLTDDDTILVTIYTVGTLLDDAGICQLMFRKGLANRLKQILNLRQDDDEILIHDLYDLYYLLYNNENAHMPLSSKSAAFIDQLISFTSHNNECIVRYSSSILEMFTESNDESLKKRIINGRFLEHNSKWVSMIEDHRNRMSGHADGNTDINQSYLNVDEHIEDFDENSDIMNYSIIDPDVFHSPPSTQENLDTIGSTNEVIMSTSSSSSHYNNNKMSDRSLIDEENDFDSDLSELVRQTSLTSQQRWQQSERVTNDKWNLEDRLASRPQTSYMTRHT